MVSSTGRWLAGPDNLQTGLGARKRFAQHVHIAEVGRQELYQLDVNNRMPA
jgi:hypothetical protein